MRPTLFVLFFYLATCIPFSGCSSDGKSSPFGGNTDGEIGVYNNRSEYTDPFPIAHTETYDLPQEIALKPTGVYEEPSYVFDSVPVDASYKHLLNFWLTPMMPPWRESLRTPGPLILFDDQFNCIVMSAFDHPFAALVWFEDGEIHYGLNGELQYIDAEGPQRFVVASGKGILNTLIAWGSAMQSEGKKTPPDPYADPGLSYLGYWTDNGAAYYYNTEEGMNEEETLLAVRDEAETRKIPYGYMQLDSWWYYKENMDSLSPGGLTRWEPLPSMFPEGLKIFQQKLGLPLMFHNRWLAETNDYLGDYDFIQGDGMLLPENSRLYDLFIGNVLAWGGFTYEQDWLVKQFWGVPALRESLTAGPSWMKSMDDAAAKRAGVTTQLCMAAAPHLLDSVHRSAPTTVRTSIDYAANVCKACYWPQFHTVNMVVATLGLWPFKDNFRSSEERGEAEALISTLSAGMVGVGDAIGKANREILMKTCRDDGLLLKPDRPAMPIDPMFLDHTRPYTTIAWSKRDNESQRWGYIAAYHLSRNHPERDSLDELQESLQYDGKDLGKMFVWPDLVTDWSVNLNMDFDVSGKMVWYDWRAETAQLAENTMEWEPVEGLGDFVYAVIVPVFTNDLALIGEPGKFVTMAYKRFKTIEAVENGFNVELEGAPGENVVLRTYDVRNTTMLPDVSVTISEEGAGRAEIRR